MDKVENIQPHLLSIVRKGVNIAKRAIKTVNTIIKLITIRIGMGKDVFTLKAEDEKQQHNVMQIKDHAGELLGVVWYS